MFLGQAVSVENALGGPDMTQDENIQKRVLELTQEAAVIINEIQRIAPKGTADPLADFGTLSQAVKIGILGAPNSRTTPLDGG